jgi:hypothetical protein
LVAPGHLGNVSPVTSSTIPEATVRTILFTAQAIATAAEQAPEGLTNTGIRDTTDYEDLMRRALAADKASRRSMARNSYPGSD